MKYRTKEECCSGCRGASVTHTCGNQGHPAAPLLRELAEVAEWHPESWREFEWRTAAPAKWKPCCSANDMLRTVENGFEVRRRRHTKRIGEYDVPLPVREAPEEDQKFYVADPAGPTQYMSLRWQGTELDYAQFRRGLIHLDPESAAIHGKALASLIQEGEG